MPYYKEFDANQAGEDFGSLVSNLMGYKDKQAKDKLLQDKLKAETENVQAEATGRQLENRPMADIVSEPRTKAMLSQIFTAPVPADDLISGRLDTTQSGINAARDQALRDQFKYGNATVKQYKDISTAENPMNLQNAKDPTLAEMYPGITPDQIAQTFGEGVTPQTRMSGAKMIGSLRIQKNRSDQMFPVAALSPEGQAAAARAGLGSIIPISVARTINGANPLRPPTDQEIKDTNSADLMKSELGNIQQLFQEVGPNAIGADKYYVNKFGAYVPFVNSDPKAQELYRLINSVNNRMVYLLSGKQINESEARRIKSTMLEPELNMSAFASRLAGFSNDFNYVSNLQDAAISGARSRPIARPTGANPSTPKQEHKPTGEQANPNPSAPPKIGEIRPGDNNKRYRYRGGAETDKNSWVEVSAEAK